MVGITEFISTIEMWGLIDVFIPFVILLFILFLLSMAITNLTRLRMLTQIIVSASVSIILSIVLVAGHVTALLPHKFNIVEMINMYRPMLILYSFVYFISLFPLVFIKKYFRISLLVIYLTSFLFTPHFIIFIVPFSALSLFYNFRDEIVNFEIKYISIIISVLSLGLGFFLRNNSFIINYFGSKWIIALFIGGILWAVLAMILFVEKFQNIFK